MRIDYIVCPDTIADKLASKHHITVREGRQVLLNKPRIRFTKEGVEEILNLQPKGRHAKPYQVKQTRHVILKYRFGGAPDVS